MRTGRGDTSEPGAPYPDLPPSLATASVGEEVVIHRILLGLVQVRCRRQGIDVGDRLLVEGRRDGRVLVSNRNGGLVDILSPYAFFVRVRRRHDVEENGDGP